MQSAQTKKSAIDENRLDDSVDAGPDSMIETPRKYDQVDDAFENIEGRWMKQGCQNHPNNLWPLAACKICLKELRRDQKKAHIKIHHPLSVLSEPKLDDSTVTDNDGDENNQSCANCTIETLEKYDNLEDAFENIEGRWWMSGGQKRTLARCKICSKELRRDTIREHLRVKHASQIQSMSFLEKSTVTNNEGSKRNNTSCKSTVKAIEKFHKVNDAFDDIEEDDNHGVLETRFSRCKVCLTVVSKEKRSDHIRIRHPSSVLLMTTPEQPLAVETKGNKCVPSLSPCTLLLKVTE